MVFCTLFCSKKHVFRPISFWVFSWETISGPPAPSPPPLLSAKNVQNIFFFLLRIIKWISPQKMFYGGEGGGDAGKGGPDFVSLDWATFWHFWMVLFSCYRSRKTRCCKIFANYDKLFKMVLNILLFCCSWLQDFQKRVVAKYLHI